MRNRRARHDFDLEAPFEAGIVLLGSEVKSLREAHASLTDAFCEVRGTELWLINAQIEPYPWANQFNHEPRRARKLLAHRAEIKRLAVKSKDKGFTLIPTEIYVLGGKIKVEVALGKGRKDHEKREAKKEREAEREMDRARGRG